MKKKLLFLTPQLPYPPVSGGVIKSWKLIEFLSEKYEVYLASFLKNNDQEHLEEFHAKISLFGSFYIPLNIPRTPFNLIKSNLQAIPLNLYRNKCSKFKGGIQNALMFADIIFVDHYEMYQYVPKEFLGKKVLHQHNCEYLMWDRFAALEKNAIKKLALTNQAFWIKRYEKKICKHADIVLAAPNDEEELIKIGANPKKFRETFHLGDESLLDLPELQFLKTENSIFYCGTLTWEANVDGLIWFINSGWKPLKEKYPDLKFYITGKNPDNRIVNAIKENQAKGIELTGFVDDLDIYFQKSKVFISPLRFGSGIKVKVMNALYRGIPTVTTSVGAEGLAVKSGDQIFISDNMADFIHQISLLIEDELLWNQFKLNSRALAKEKYTWDNVLKIVENAIEE
ncbi:MAG: glycosyltransferase [Bacteroidetes bacterium]|nr:glycosyltransferase [Bacteroidota bacterium]